MISPLLNKRKGRLEPHHLIAIILLLTFVGIGIWYLLPIIGTSDSQAPETTPKPYQIPIDPAIAAATKKTSNLVYGGLPKSLGNQQLKILSNIGFYAAYSEDRRNPLWVAYKIDAVAPHPGLARPSGFKVDMRTISRVEPNAYSKSGYDRGHLAPNSAISSRLGRDAQLETFLMSNIIPQTPELNRRTWANLERLEMEYAERFGTIWVITGPVFGEHVKRIANTIDIPDACFKILVKEMQGYVKTLAFIVPQTVTGREPINSFLTSIREIERLTGLDFFWPMDDEYEEQLESSTANSLW